jgi:prefoldin subunit 5
MNVALGFARILCDVAPKNITKATNYMLKILRTVNNVLVEINSIDWCNPLGYILSKAPFEGSLEAEFFKYQRLLFGFINEIEEQLNPLRLAGETDQKYRERILKLQENIDRIAQTIQDFVPPTDLLDQIPGGIGLSKTFLQVQQAIQPVTEVTQTVLNPFQSIITKVTILQNFAAKLTSLVPPFIPPEISSTIREAEADINAVLAGIIRPERFRDDVQKVIKSVQAVDKAIVTVQQIVKTINNVLKGINTAIKVFLAIKKFLKKKRTPLAVGGGGGPVVSQTNADTNTEADLLANTSLFILQLQLITLISSDFLNTSVLRSINRIRSSILRIIASLNVLYTRLRSCNLTAGDTNLLNSVQSAIDSLNNNLNTLDELFPTARTTSLLPLIYNGYTINIIKEEVTDEGITLLRRRVVVADQRGVIEYEGTATYATDDQVLIKEGQLYIDRQRQTRTSDLGNDSPTDQEVLDIIESAGYNLDDVFGGTLPPD